MVASGEKVRTRGADNFRRLVQPWQQRAFAYYNIVPEVKFAAQFYSRGLAPLRLYAAELDEDGELQPTDNEDVRKHLDRIQDPGGGRINLLSSYGRLMFLTGETILFVTIDPDTELERWEMLSTREVIITEDGRSYQRRTAPGLDPETYRNADDGEYAPDEKTAVAYRLWRRHPEYSDLADSTMQGVLDVAEELVLLTQAVRSRARSRLAGSGILIVNGKVTPVPQNPTPDEDASEDPFIDDLNDAMLAPMVDEGSASAVVPLVVRVETDDLDQVMKHIQIIDPTELYPETGLRMEAVKRLAIGLDMPPEVLLGLQDSNHWSAWQVDEQTWKAHLQPVAQQLVDDLTAAFLLPQLREDGIADWQKYRIAYDAAAVVNHPDRTRDAKDLHDRGELNGDALRAAAGFTDDDKPSEEERLWWLGAKIHDGALAVYGTPSVKSGGVETGPGAVTKEGAPSEVVPGTTPADVEPGPPAEPVDGGVVGSGNGNGGPPVERLVGASEQTLLRARELAGSRLRSLAKRDPDARLLVEGVPAHKVPAALGRDAAARIGAPPERRLVAGAALMLAQLFELEGLDPALADRIGDRIEQHAARTLWDERPKPLPPSFRNYLVGQVARPRQPA